MRLSLPILLSAGLVFGIALAQTAHKSPSQPTPVAAGISDETNPGKTTADDVQQLHADVQRLKVLLNQMRTNLAFVQTTQTPLKHQFELEVDAWQVIVEQMERRLKRVEQNGNSKPKQQ
jgi:hypothetical protein